MNSRFEWDFVCEKKRHERIRDGTDIASWIQPTNVETKRIAVMLLSPFRVLDREFPYGRGECRSRPLPIHDSSPLRSGLEVARTTKVVVNTRKRDLGKMLAARLCP